MSAVSTEPAQIAGDPLDALTLRRTFGCFPSSVVAVCAQIAGAPVGLVASTFVPVSLDPPLVAFCVQQTSATWPRLRAADTLGISALNESQSGTAKRLASRDPDKFADVEHDVRASGAVHLRESAAALECRVTAEHPAGDHLIVVLEIQQHWSAPMTQPLVFHASNYRRLHLI